MGAVDFRTAVWLATAVCGLFAFAGIVLAPTFGSRPLALRLILANSAMCCALLVRLGAPSPTPNATYALMWTIWGLATLALVSALRILTDQASDDRGLARQLIVVALLLGASAWFSDSAPVIGIVAGACVSWLSTLCCMAAWRICLPELRRIRLWLIGTFALGALCTAVHLPARVVEVLNGSQTMPATGATYVALLLLWIAANVGLMVLVQARLAEQVAGIAQTDELTGLLNRRGIHARLARVTVPAGQAQAGAVIMVDIDHFKSINDRWGHDTGDQVLVWFAAQLRSYARTGDLAARMGGEEFALILANCSVEQAMARAQRICSGLADHGDFEGGSETIRVTASFGVAAFPGHFASLKGTLARADEALYAAKHAGRSAVRCWHPATVRAVDPFEHDPQSQTLVV